MVYHKMVTVPTRIHQHEQTCAFECSAMAEQPQHLCAAALRNLSGATNVTVEVEPTPSALLCSSHVTYPARRSHVGGPDGEQSNHRAAKHSSRGGDRADLDRRV